LNVGDINSVVTAAIGGQAITQVLQGERTFNLIFRWRAILGLRSDGLARPQARYDGSAALTLAEPKSEASRLVRWLRQV